MLILTLAAFTFLVIKSKAKSRQKEKEEFVRNFEQKRQQQFPDTGNADAAGAAASSAADGRPKITINKTKDAASGIKETSSLPAPKREVTASSSAESRWSKIQYPPTFIHDAEKYFPIPLSDWWRESQVSDIFIHDACAARIDEFVFNDNNLLLNMRNAEIPEIGGFLLGKAEKNQHTGKYQVSLERFVNIESEDFGVYQISFGSKAWSKLEKQTGYYEDEGYKLMGWFHTHPGHGLFLSRPDQNIHQTWFKEPYHIAMELDSLQSDNNPHFQTGFFTWKNQGVLNNAEGKKTDWLRWTDVRRWYKHGA
ncbi:MAG: hypothetical protein IPM82_07430 [Saprospiraceae bacterium]|nr:hypothetical protein [Saprospiraceae bacterium]